MASIVDLLNDGDRRTVGNVEEVVKRVLIHPDEISYLFRGLRSDNPSLRMRCADALEKIAVQNSTLLQPFTKDLLDIARCSIQQEVQWHMAQLFSRLRLSKDEVKDATTIAHHYFNYSPSNIVKVMSLQAITDLANSTQEREKAQKLILKAVKSESASVRARANLLLKDLENYHDPVA